MVVHVMPDLCNILQYRHASHFLLDGTVVVDLVPKLCSVRSMIHLLKRGTRPSLPRTLIHAFHLEQHQTDRWAKV